MDNKFAALIVLLITLMLLIVGCTDDATLSASQLGSNQQNDSATDIAPGDDCVIRMDNGKPGDLAFIATSMSSWKKWNDACFAKDEVGKQNLESSGEIIWVPVGTKVKFLEFGDAFPDPMAHIRIEDGDYVDKDGYTHLSWVNKPQSQPAVQAANSEQQPAPSTDINGRDEDGMTALMTAASKGDSAGVKSLISEGAAVNLAETHGSKTALMQAAVSGSVDCVNALIEGGADVNAKDNGGNTALSLAAFSGSVECVKVLIKKGAKLNTRDSFGDTPLATAIENNNTECAEVLRAAGARK